MRIFLALLALVSSLGAIAEDTGLDEIINFRSYSANFASAGQPTAEQLAVLKRAGYERIFYIAFSDHENSLPNEDRVVKELGMQYVQIPVDWQRPMPADFYAFADAMRRDPGKRTLLHCQVNARATAFSFLYRVIFDKVPVADAKADMNTVWQPNQVWRDFIFTVLNENAISPECPGCDWTPPPPMQH